MGTLSKSLTENYASKRSTWTFTTSCNDVSVTGDTFPVPLPTVTAKYVYSGKNVAFVTDFRIYPIVGSSYYSSNWSNFTYGGGDLALNPWASNASKTLSRTGGGTILSDRSTSAFFNTSNKTTRTIPLTYKCHTVSADSAIKSSDGYIYAGNDGQLRLYSSDTGMPFDIATANITLNAPPTVMNDTPVYSAPHYAGLGAYNVTVTSAEAQYGGDIQTITLTIGSDSVTQNYSTATVTNQTLSLTPTVAGTYTPTIIVTDSRGQVTTINLEQITVNAYTAPNISFDLQRTNGSGIPNAEGEHGLVTASISYTNAIAELTQPTVVVKDEGGNTIASSTTWYETWDATNGVSNAVNWTNYNPQSPATLYAVVSATGSSFSPNESYTVSITPTDNRGGVAQTITQTLSTGFFTIDFKAGGKEIAFGAPANDDVTNYPEGLFKCAMSFVNVNMVGEIKAYAGVTIPNGWLECDGSEVLKADYPILYGAIADSWGVASDADHFVLPNMKGRVPVGYDSSDTDFDSVGESGGAKSVTLGTSEIPAHTHGNKSLTGYFTSRRMGPDNQSHWGGGVFSVQQTSGSNVASAKQDVANKHGDQVNIDVSHEHTSVGGSGAHNNLQPYAVVKYIICAI